MQSRATDMTTNLRGMMLDLLVAGEPLYKTEPTVDKNNVSIRHLDPRNVFIDYNLDSPYIKNSHRIVVRNWMTKTQILNKYGREMSAEDRKKLEDHWEAACDSSNYYIKHNISGSKGILAGDEVIIPGYPEQPEGTFTEFIPVYEVEWLEVDKDFVMQRYENIRIGEEIYIIKGKDENVIRSKDNPNYCCLSVNGVRFLNRNNKPHSLVLACANLQD